MFYRLSVIVLLSLTLVNSIRTSTRKKFFDSIDYSDGANGCGVTYKDSIDWLKSEVPGLKPFCMLNRLKSVGSFILGDAGSSGTRLLLFRKSDEYGVVIPGLPLAAQEPTKIKSIVDKLKKDLKSIDGVIILATAGVRQNLDHFKDPMTEICTSGDSSCISATMLGTLEGYLGWLDLTNNQGSKGTTLGDNHYCYVEIGGMSAQFVSPITTDEPEAMTGINGEKLFSMSGVTLGNNVIAVLDPSKPFDFGKKASMKKGLIQSPGISPVNIDTRCMAMIGDDKVKFHDRCKPKIDHELITMDITKCDIVAKKTKTCSKLFIKGIHPSRNKEIHDFMILPKSVKILDRIEKSKCLSKNIPDKFGGNFSCGRAMLWHKWFVKLGLEDMLIDATYYDPSSDQLEWYSGLITLISNAKFNFGLFKSSITSMVRPKSDCEPVIIQHS
jgi:hypothetical protein